MFSALSSTVVRATTTGPWEVRRTSADELPLMSCGVLIDGEQAGSPAVGLVGDELVDVGDDRGQVLRECVAAHRLHHRSPRLRPRASAAARSDAVARGVASDHVAARPAGDGHQAALGAACGEPAVRGGVPQQVRVEALDPGQLGAVAQRLVQPVVGELLAAVAEPQRGGVGQAVAAAGADVAVERGARSAARTARCGPCRPCRGAPSPVPRLRSTSAICRATTSPARIPVSTISRTIASSRRVPQIRCPRTP